MGAVEEALEPGEEVRFEGAARGWPPFSLEAGLAYSAGLLLLLLVTAAGGLAAVLGETIDVGVSGLWPVSLPLWLAAVGLVVAVEAWRTVRFRSTVHAITTARVLTLAGVVRVRPRAELGLVGGETVTLVDGDPCVQGEGALRLVGLGAENLDAVRLALGLPPEPAPPPSRRRRRGRVFAGVAVVLLGAAQVMGALGARDCARFAALEAAVRVASGAAQARIDPAQAPAGGYSGSAGTFRDRVGELDLSQVDTSRRQPGQPRQPLTVAAARIECRMVWGLLTYAAPTVTVTQPTPGERNSELLQALREEFDAAGIEAIWR